MQNYVKDKEYFDDMEEFEDISWQMKVETLPNSLYFYDKNCDKDGEREETQRETQ